MIESLIIEYANYIRVFGALGLCILCGFAFRTVLSICGQIWVRTYHHTLTFLLLPVITFVVTSVIAGNIALSLGMIGALSIVRFRNPVKNPLELVIFFALLSIGISAGVDLRWTVLLTGTCLFVFVASYIIDRRLAADNKRAFSLSFDEGNPVTVLEVTSSSPIPGIEGGDAVRAYHFSSDDHTHVYKLAFRTREEANEVKRLLSSEPIKKLLVNYN